MTIQCSNCGLSKQFEYTSLEVLALTTEGWNSCGSALYCPDCSATWARRNGNRPMSGVGHTMRLIDGIYERGEHI